MALKADSGPAYNWNQGRPYADATDAAALGPSSLGAPRHRAWAGCFIFARYSLHSRNQ